MPVGKTILKSTKQETTQKNDDQFIKDKWNNQFNKKLQVFTKTIKTNSTK